MIKLVDKGIKTVTVLLVFEKIEEMLRMLSRNSNIYRKRSKKNFSI